jgi:hypothetical protein
MMSVPRNASRIRNSGGYTAEPHELVAVSAELNVSPDDLLDRLLALDLLDALSQHRIGAGHPGHWLRQRWHGCRWLRHRLVQKLLEILAASSQAHEEVRHVSARPDFFRQFDALGVRDELADPLRTAPPRFVVVVADVDFGNRLKLLRPLRAKDSGPAGGRDRDKSPAFHHEPVELPFADDDLVRFVEDLIPAIQLRISAGCCKHLGR